jgi:hypothetical protein
VLGVAVISVAAVRVKVGLRECDEVKARRMNERRGTPYLELVVAKIEELGNGKEFPSRNTVIRPAEGEVIIRGDVRSLLPDCTRHEI